MVAPPCGDFFGREPPGTSYQEMRGLLAEIRPSRIASNATSRRAATKGGCSVVERWFPARLSAIIWHPFSARQEKLFRNERAEAISTNRLFLHDSRFHLGGRLRRRCCDSALSWCGRYDGTFSVLRSHRGGCRGGLGHYSGMGGVEKTTIKIGRGKRGAPL